MKKAFSLVELLVVIAILAVLTGVLISTFGSAGESALATKCLANMRNLAMAVQSYAMGGGGSYPDANKWISRPSKDGGNFISPYDSNMELREFSLTNGTLWAACNRSRDCYFCPLHQRYTREHNLGADPLWSYAMSRGISGSYGSIDRADRTLLFAELPYGGEDLSDEQMDPVLDFKDETEDDSGNDVIGFNHKVGKNTYAHVCFADGHVEKMIAPKRGSVEDLTAWLCKPTEKIDGAEVNFDIFFDGAEYKKSDKTE